MGGWRFGLIVREYRKLEACDACRVETWARISKLYGWPQKFVEERSSGAFVARNGGYSPPTSQSSMKGER